MKRVAFYGSLRQGEYNYRPEQGEPIATGHITNAILVGGYAYPWVIPSDKASDTVVVEVYDIDDAMFDRIDRMEKGAGYEARTVEVHTIGDELEDIDTLPALVYFYKSPKALEAYPRIASGDWSKRNVNPVKESA